ncbi:uncharacterized protein SPPG_08390 [Spizellomyces punctatus DAOM BR117]|uniref:Methyltransferase domain-containing protein n=1 Tax=Spizellomyces punctatus (strain DAOM BR117) TaxID=645134 RepID=A0A0L0H5Q5_SPIPD|nr:uncharacterized protein SPPG_08390 [Spizellomyces punctatus DAOM BR117]KNC96236.1 hypothetical protein SPPG_08390 [Spizellomyces punctatus DAOM BR117]|eukprot:XP_016604276.1 hypothetical protein SPPG_08390 [Spizellomyces punctatus DAOM BR117]
MPKDPAPTVTPRTAIIGAHQGNGVSVGGTGGKLSRSGSSSKSGSILSGRLAAIILVAAVLLATDWIPAKSYLGSVKRHLSDSYTAIRYLPTGFQVVAFGSILVAGFFTITAGKPYVVFAWNCFIKPFLKKKPTGIDSDEHQKRLEQFYEGQAEVYDVTRKRLLRGRSTMLRLCGAQLQQVYPAASENDVAAKTELFSKQPSVLPSPPSSPTFPNAPSKRTAWIDVGGGTGENIEKMNATFPISNFTRVYLVDITPSLCEVARQRFQRLGWNNVRVLCMDASKFAIPEEDGPEDLEIALITMSYSLSMIETFYPLIDRLAQVLSPNGIFGIADFYVSQKRSADPSRQLSWLMRWFWSIWFDFDNVYLHPCRREYLEHKFKTVKSFNGKNKFIKPFVKIPYYVWIGAKQEQTIPTFKLEAAALNGSGSDSESELYKCPPEVPLPAEKVLPVACQGNGHVLSDHIHGHGYRWRQPFDPKLLSRFSTYIYAFAWEDPRVDLEFMELTPNDRMLVITSGGCNVLEYAAKVGPARIHAVDLNPCQNNMLELKLAGISSLEFSEFWKLFGEGHIPNFESVLDTKLSPFLSPSAFSFWKENAGFSNLFQTGCSGLAIRVFQFVIKLRGLRDAVRRMCSAVTLDEQKQIWKEEIRPHFLSTWLITLLNNDRFLWGALGVPPAQMQMLIEEGTAYEYIVNTFDPVIENTHLRTDNYFYYLPLMLKYNPRNVPAYLSKEGYRALQTQPARLNAIKIHTDVIVSVLERECEDGELTRIILMDHLDWFSHEDAEAEIGMVARKCATGGRVYWRSAGKRPWYNIIFEQKGFDVKPLQIREGSTMYIDRVNMYASLWCGIKL